jgi:Ribbon-helix-helix protein, copG family
VTERVSKTRRVQLDLPERSIKRLEALKERTEATSYAEVLREALTLYERIIEQYDDGKRLLVRDKDGKISEYDILIV